MLQATAKFMTLFMLTAPATASDSSLLGSKLTYNGAEMGGTSDGVIPAFKGGITTPPVGYKAGGDHIDPFADDRPRYTITAANVDHIKLENGPADLDFSKLKEGDFRPSALRRKIGR